MNRAALQHVSADTGLLERCAGRLFASSAQPLSDPRRRARFRAAAVDPSRLESRSGPETAIPFGIRLWLSYLLWLESTLETLSAGCFAGLTADEGAGLAALARARGRFLHAHVICPRCDAPNPRGAARCRRCARELKL